MVENSLGKIAGLDGCYRIESTIAISAPIEEVWDTATDSEKVGWWFAHGKVEGEGGQIQLNYSDGKFGMVGEVRVLFRPHVFEFTWESDQHSDRTIIRFDFVVVKGGETQVTLTSFVFDQLETTFYVIATWRFMLERLQLAVATKVAIPDDEARVAKLVQDFRKQHEQCNVMG